jgi:hypothetical protein
MAITLYKKPNFNGDRFVVTANRSSLKTSAVKNGTSSLTLSSDADKALFFKREDYNGGVMFRQGRWNISKMSSKAQGGKIGFGDTLSSVRLTPFNVKVFVTVIQTDAGGFPGTLTSQADATTYLNSVFAEANTLWAQGLIRLQRRGTIFRRSTKFHDMKGEAFLLAIRTGWKEAGHINVFLVNTLKGALGMQIPCSGKTIVLVHNSVAEAGNTLAHEVGHFLGLSHDSAQRDNTNVMQGPGKGRDWWVGRRDFSGQQIEDAHEKLSKHITKKVVREE